MNTLPVLATHQGRFSRRFRQYKYLWVSLLATLIVAGLVVAYLSKSPVYASALSVVLPGSGSSSNFAIDDVGSASQSTRTPFSSIAFNPLVNYKEIFKSRGVIQSAAARLGVHPTALTPPRIELRERTSIIYIHADGGSAESAQRYAWALFDSFQEELERLRQDEMLRRDNSISSVMEQYRLRLMQTRQAIVDFQQRSLLVSGEQVTQLMHTLTNINERRISVQSSVRNAHDFVRQLGIDLGVSPALAGQAFRLQSDPEFRGYLKELDTSAMKVAEYSSLWGSKHPKVVAQNLRYDTAQQSLKFRSTKLVGTQSAEILHNIDLASSIHRAELFASLMENYAKLQGLQAESTQLDITETKLEDRLKVFTRESAELERLEREHALAEAVFTSAAVKLEAGKSDIFASYPALQMLGLPSLPYAPKSPNTTIAIAIGAMAILFILFGLFTAWHRQYLISLLLKNS
ncbi:GumC family protein [Teredinibacter franksiae]|uniref:GumC family protein n=1 Tax=Teredinibacter franksiae TaxID=2761453 RepID=UPI00162470D9|nr:hypothetical protein [Teredinibacter franksiae]